MDGVGSKALRLLSVTTCGRGSSVAAPADDGPRDQTAERAQVDHGDEQNPAIQRLVLDDVRDSKRVNDQEQAVPNEGASNGADDRANERSSKT